jgi:hypothetical protein
VIVKTNLQVSWNFGNFLSSRRIISPQGLSAIRSWCQSYHQQRPCITSSNSERSKFIFCYRKAGIVVSSNAQVVPVSGVQVQHYEVTTRLDIVGHLIPFRLQSATTCVSSSDSSIFLPVLECQGLMNKTSASHLVAPGVNLSMNHYQKRFLWFHSVSKNSRLVAQNGTQLEWNLFIS